LHVAGATGKACRGVGVVGLLQLMLMLVLVLVLMLALVLMLVLVLVLVLVLGLGWGGRRGQGRRSRRVRGGRERAGDPNRRQVRSEVVLEDRKVRHGRVHHLREVVVCEFGRDEVATPELVLAHAAALVDLFLNVAHGPVHGERHAVARDDGVVDDIWVRELLVHHV